MLDRKTENMIVLATLGICLLAIAFGWWLGWMIYG